MIEAAQIGRWEDVSKPEEIGAKLRLAASHIQKTFCESADFRFQACIRLLSGDLRDIEDEALRRELQSSDIAYRHYLISALYMLLMPRSRRQRLAAFFTPPYLSDYILDRLKCHGHDFSKHSILDPACGGAAFLVPIAQRIATTARSTGMPPSTVVQRVSSLLHGIEIEPNLARLSQLMIEKTLNREIELGGQRPSTMVIRGNSLKQIFNNGFDAVISNPPYGRVFRPSKALIERWKSVITDGHVNTYALFIGVALENLRSRGLAALIVPTSFAAGPYFASLRKYIAEQAELLQIDLIEKRSKVFLDVTQDTCVLFLRKRGFQTMSYEAPRCNLIGDNGTARDLGPIEMLSPERQSLWILPRSGAHSQRTTENGYFQRGLVNLTDLGYVVKSGYFVWNRSRDRLATRNLPLPSEVPLVWAHNVKPGQPVELSPGPMRATGDPDQISCVRIEANNPALLTSKSLIVQRTTNRNQRRRLIAGIINDELLSKYGAFISENHTIAITQMELAPPTVSIELLLKLINSEAVDARYRQISGTVSISTKLLRILPLPAPKKLKEAMAMESDFESAVELAYRRSTT
jgi:adenine-specific DNA-methyltransferase